jgi:hypothetical protein
VRGPWRWLADRLAERRALAEYRQAWRRLSALRSAAGSRQPDDALPSG